jgi:hypothetical protein
MCCCDGTGVIPKDNIDKEYWISEKEWKYCTRHRKGLVALNDRTQILIRNSRPELEGLYPWRE